MKAQSISATTEAPWPARSDVSRTELDPVSFLHRSAAVHPERVAVVDGERRWTYAELGVVPEHVVHPVLLGGWWLLKPQSQGGPDEVAR
jgi:non-ribosomal peptide synthetase component F